MKGSCLLVRNLFQIDRIWKYTNKVIPFFKSHHHLLRNLGHLENTLNFSIYNADLWQFYNINTLTEFVQWIHSKSLVDYPWKEKEQHSISANHFNSFTINNAFLQLVIKFTTKLRFILFFYSFFHSLSQRGMITLISIYSDFSKELDWGSSLS